MCIDPIVIKKIGKMFFYKATQYKSYYIHVCMSQVFSVKRRKKIFLCSPCDPPLSPDLHPS